MSKATRRAGAVAGTGLLAGALVAGAPAHAEADKLVVKSTKPKGKGSFAGVLERASRKDDKDTIVFAAKLSGSISIKPDKGPGVKGPVRIKAKPGDPKLRSRGKGATITFKDAETVAVDGLHTKGVGLEAYYVDLKVRDSTITGNDRGVGVNGYRDSDLFIRRSVISDFDTGVDSYYLSSVEIERSTISFNDGPGVTNGTYSHTDIEKSTISHNGGGGVSAGYESSVDITDSTISRNRSDADGGGVSGEADIVHSTITGNEGRNGGGIDAYYEVTVADSIVSGNKATDGDANCSGDRLKSLGGNVWGSGAACDVVAQDTVAGNPKLGPLKNNGGPTETHMPNPGSPVIDAGGLSWRADQRGFEVKRNAKPDSGSVERGAKAP